MAKSQTPKQLRRSRLWEWIKIGSMAIVLWYLFTNVAVQAFHIPSGSMENTLLRGDFLFANKALYGAEVPLLGFRLPALRDPMRGDIVIFDSVSDETTAVVKRVLGIPGDTIEMENRQLLINGHTVDEAYAQWNPLASDRRDPAMRSWQRRYYIGDDVARYRPSARTWGPLVVPRDSFLVLGDNRDDSYDSRYWGFLARERVRGRPMFVYYSCDIAATDRFPCLSGVRWRRIFTRPN